MVELEQHCSISNFVEETRKPEHNITEQWNGTSWTEVNEFKHKQTRVDFAGIQTSAIVLVVDYPPVKIANNRILGWKSWTEVNDLATARTDARWRCSGNIY